jgi:hypothetical protein
MAQQGRQAIHFAFFDGSFRNSGSPMAKNCLLPGGKGPRKSWDAEKSKLPF